MGILTAPSSAAAGLDLTRCQWVPVDKSLPDAELRGTTCSEVSTATSGGGGDATANGAKVQVMRGSLTVHEVCAEGMLGLRAAARKRAREKVRMKALTLAAMNRWGGRSLPLGTDRAGQQYLVFPADPQSVYVQPTTADKLQGLMSRGPSIGNDRRDDDGGGGDDVWKVFTGKDAVAGLMLGLSPRLPRESEGRGGRLRGDGSAEQVGTAARKWEAVVREVRHSSGGDGGGGGGASATSGGSASASSSGRGEAWYLVSFRGWSRRFDRWERASALSSLAGGGKGDATEVEEPEEEEEAEEEDDEERMSPSSGGARRGTGPGLPPQDDEYLQPKVLQGLEASYQMDKPGRARGLRCSVPSFTTAETESSAQTRAKAMILTIQAALPSGARLRARGRFDGGLLQPWITFVQEASTALELMEAWLLLESSINPRWLESSSKR
ncbi:unnamed protein product [Ectocarpus sp. 6 AP-2014]